LTKNLLHCIKDMLSLVINTKNIQVLFNQDIKKHSEADMMTLNPVPNLRTTLQSEGDISIVGFRPYEPGLDMDCDALAEHLVRLLEKGDVVVDLGNLESLTSGPLGVLVAADKIAESSPRSLIMANPSTPVLQSLKLTGWDSKFNPRQSVSEALAELSN